MNSSTTVPSRPVIALTTAITMVAFASNSVLCRLALGGGSIDPVGFTSIRLTSGAIMLLTIARLGGRRRTLENRGSWASALALFAYAIAFSLAYVRLDAGTGALILFAAVQITMIVWGIAGGERPDTLQWGGLAVAMAGLVYLVFPGLTAPSPTASFLMTVAGIAWGAYSLRGRGARDPIVSTTDNFVRSVPMIAAVAVVDLQGLNLSAGGLGLAVASGALASGVGYVLWYFALRGLSATRAATVQLTVPVIAACGGIVFLSEAVTARLALSSVLVLGGVGMTLYARAIPDPAATRES